jgi:serine/threonine protein kinase
MQSVMPFTASDGGPVSLMDRTMHPGSEGAAPASPLPSPPGYEIIGTLGRGGMGVVYLAKQVQLDRAVALKMILGGGHASDQARARFRAEARSVASLQHPNILAVYDFGEHAGNLFLAMEFCPGGTLAERLNQQPLEMEEAARLVSVLARALAHAHERGIIHRDVKPGNVLFSAAAVPKLTDFGLARRQEDGGPLTHEGAVLGTPAYMAPEQAQARKDIGPQADVYSLGAVLFHCLTGRPPFAGPSLMDIIVRLLHEAAPPPSRLRPEVPAVLDAICQRAMERDPSRRFTASALADTLDTYLSGDKVTGLPHSRRWWWPFG